MPTPTLVLTLTSGHPKLECPQVNRGLPIISATRRVSTGHDALHCYDDDSLSWKLERRFYLFSTVVITLVSLSDFQCVTHAPPAQRQHTHFMTRFFEHIAPVSSSPNHTLITHATTSPWIFKLKASDKWTSSYRMSCWYTYNYNRLNILVSNCSCPGDDATPYEPTRANERIRLLHRNRK